MQDPKASPLWLRKLLQWTALSAGRHTLPERATQWPDFWDNTNGIGEVKRKLFYKDRNTGIMLPFKGRARPVPILEKIGVEAHITAIAFGVSKKAVMFWRSAIVEGLVPQWTLFDSDPAKAATRMALHARFWMVPYHYVGLLNGDVLFNNAVTAYTFHGNGGNRPFIGLSLEGNYPGLERKRKKKHNGYDEHTILTGRAAFRLSVTRSRKEGAPVEFLHAHRQYSDGRLGDPGEGWWKEIGIPMSQELKLQRQVTFVMDSGTEVCREWDPLGRVDYRGKRL